MMRPLPPDPNTPIGPRPLFDEDDIDAMTALVGRAMLFVLAVVLFVGAAFALGVAAGLVVVGYRLVTGG